MRKKKAKTTKREASGRLKSVRVELRGSGPRGLESLRRRSKCTGRSKRTGGTRRKSAALTYIEASIRHLAVPIGTVKGDSDNRRRHSQRNLEVIRRALKDFRQQTPIVRDADGVLRKGHGTLEAAIALGWTHIAVVDSTLRGKAAELYAVADNRSGDPDVGSEWNEAALAEFLTEIQADADLDVASAGFEDGEIQELIDRAMDELAGKKGFRPGAGNLAATITDWRGADDFFACAPEWRERFERAEAIVVEFSGGKDSLAVLLWVRRNFAEKPTQAVFVDTGVEFPGLPAYVTATAESLGAEPVIIKPQLEWWSWLQQKSEWPSLLFRDCAFKFIHEPWAKWVKIHHQPDTVVVCTGSRAEEAVRGSKKTATAPLSTFGAKAEAYPHVAPCFNVKKPELEAALAASGVAVWEGYARGFVRTACWCCMGQNGKQACALQDNYPGLCDDIRRWEKRLGPIKATSDPPRTFDDTVRAGRKQLAREAAKTRKRTPARP